MLWSFVAYREPTSVHTTGVVERLAVQCNCQPASGSGHETTTLLVAVRVTARSGAPGVCTAATTLQNPPASP